jgi:hypothetical protein
LIIYLGTASHAAKLYKIKRLSIENEQLLLEIRIEDYKYGLQYLKPWVFFIEVNKSDIEGITTIKVKSIDAKPRDNKIFFCVTIITSLFIVTFIRRRRFKFIANATTGLLHSRFIG